MTNNSYNMKHARIQGHEDNLPGRISPLSLAHLPIYAEVIRQSFATAAADYNLTRKNCPGHWSFKTDEELADKFKAGYHPFGYFLDEKLIGFVSLSDKGKGIYEMNAVSVLPEYRHFGYGKSLLDFCKRKVVELGGSTITISVAETDTVLKEWYISDGFIHTGAETFEHLPLPVGYMFWEAYPAQV